MDGIVKSMPLTRLHEIVVFPGMHYTFDTDQEEEIRTIGKTLEKESLLFLVTKKNEKELFSVGTISHILQVSKLPGGILRVTIEGKERAKFLGLTESTWALAEPLAPCEDARDENLLEVMKGELEKLVEVYNYTFPKNGFHLIAQIKELRNVERIMDHVAINLPLPYIDKQKLLELPTLKERYGYLVGLLIREREIGEIRQVLNQSIVNLLEENQKEYVIREQIQYLQEELGETEEDTNLAELEQKFHKLKAKKAIKDRIAKEIKKFTVMTPSSVDYSMQQSYVETLLEMPWDKVSKDNQDFSKAEAILEERHYGLEKVKARILEYLAVRCIKEKKHRTRESLESSSPILCLVGPPGTGKTSIAKSVAAALDKKYIRISLGGLRDEAQIRGHRKTYVGAMPGRIAMALKDTGVKNPLILLDEIDKTAADYKGDVSAALLEVLDADQNGKFRDHYIELDLDLSEVLFITTANYLADIPGPLRDRLEIIEINSYTANEKFHIAKEYLLDKQMQKNGLTEGQLVFTDDGIKKIIQSYIREAGVRELERKLGEICRKAAVKMLKGEKNVFTVSSQNMEEYLGAEKFSEEDNKREDEIGIVNGLAWTSVGGEMLQIEVNLMPGKGAVVLTGKLGDVMKESAMAAMSYVRSVSTEYEVKPETFRRNDFHIHIPEGAVPKDGPSAGITMATAILSAVTGKLVYGTVAMTGEITLRGRVLPIGGLKEKLLAANLAGMKKVLVPARNSGDLKEISKEITGEMEIMTVENMRQVIEAALV